MSEFEINKINLEAASVSEQLYLARIKKGLKLSQIARFLDINIKYLRSLESANYEILPKGLYGKNYLREYASFLELNYKQLLVDFEKERNVLGLEVKENDYFSKLKNLQTLIIYIPNIFKNILIAFSIVICFYYLSNAIFGIFSPPALKIFNPEDNLVTSKTHIQINGSADEQAQVVINGELIANTGGVFKKGVYLREGINIINISARRKFGNEAFLQRKILLKKDL